MDCAYEINFMQGFLVGVFSSFIVCFLEQHCKKTSAEPEIVPPPYQEV